MFTNATIASQLFKFQTEQKKKIGEALAYIGEQTVNDARERPSGETYTDRTGNLRSSIGYEVSSGGKSEAKKTDIHNGKGQEGANRGDALVREMKTRNDDITLHVVAGMEYAAPVEALKGHSVLSGSIPTGQHIEKTLKELLG